MKYLMLKDTELEVSTLCLGGANFGEKLNQEQSFEILDAFVRKGGNFIDTANVYCRWVSGLGNCSERVLGEWLKQRGAHQDVVIATKGAHYDLKRPEISRVTKEEIRADLEESLHTLGLDCIDFYWLHRDDTNKSIEEIMDLLEELKQEGKIRYYGLSNYSVSRLAAAEKYLKSKGKQGPYGVSNQWSLAEINAGKNMNPDPTLVEFSAEEYEWHKKSQIPAIPFSSTAMGFFEKLKSAGVVAENGQRISNGEIDKIPASLRDAYLSERNLRIYEQMVKLQEETGHSLQALSLAYLINQPFQVIPVGAVQNTAQLEGFVGAGEIEISVERFLPLR